MNRSYLSTLLIFAAFGLSLVLSGCGGHGIDFGTWAANYTGTVGLDNSKSGTLALTSDTNGIVTGTLTVTGADGADTNYKFTAGTYPLAGSITSTKGGFEVNGTVPTMGSFFIRGQFPTDASTKAFTVVTGTSATYTVSLKYNGVLTKI